MKTVDTLHHYETIRRATLDLAAPLSAEDQQLQSMPDASPTKWHLAHTTWFFETFVLAPTVAGYRPFDEAFGFLFNSYYESVGQRVARPKRGLLSRPSLETIRRYRAHVDEHLSRALTRGDLTPAALSALVLGLHHEQQHQELILTDIKHALASNPLRPAYRQGAPRSAPASPMSLGWYAHPEGLVTIGYEGDGFAFDNEGPRHRFYLAPFALASRLVTCGEYLEFMADGGYRRPELWLSDGWGAVKGEGWRAPLYWEERDGQWWCFSLVGGMRPVDSAEPVAHVSQYEADAYARWANARLPTEQEWERVAVDSPRAGNFVESAELGPRPAPGGDAGQHRPAQLHGDVWEWTQSAYTPYPGFRPAAGALGEYNGKFMSNQIVLRGGSCVTSASHIRPTYRNFFPPAARWQFSGIRLARDAV